MHETAYDLPLANVTDSTAIPFFLKNLIRCLSLRFSDTPRMNNSFPKNHFSQCLTEMSKKHYK